MNITTSPPLETLSQPDLLTLRHKIDALLATCISDTSEYSEDYLLYGMKKALEEKGLSDYMTQPDFKLFRKKSIKLRETLEKHIPNMSKAEKLQLGRICGSALYNYVSANSVVPSMKVLTHSLEMTLQALEVAFPSYLASGLLKAVLKRPLK